MNNNSKILILFPKDSTTDFLEEVVSYLVQTVRSSLFSFIRIEPSDESHQYSLEQIQNPVHNTILFLGHGTSVSLYGTCEGNYRNEKFITTKNFGIFKEKKLILVACDSRTLIKKGKVHGFEEAIGFGDLPTDWNDVQSAREGDVNAYKGFTEETIKSFRNCLVEIIKYSVSDFLSNNLSLVELYNLIFLRINKRIAKYFIDNRIIKLLLSDALLRMKHETLFINNTHI
jgi:hypothetical protein